ncbi:MULTISPECIES: hypothetical protein [Cyanophyceae]|nr:MULTISPECIES: hypothetical protein [Cyanophyceae]
MALVFHLAIAVIAQKFLPENELILYCPAAGVIEGDRLFEVL